MPDITVISPKEDPAGFWRSYAQSIGETVLGFCLARYVRGWKGFDAPLWGLFIAASGGARFHHFPHEGWFDALSRTASGKEAPREKTFFIPKERLLGAAFRMEKIWWKRLVFAPPPLITVRYRDESGGEAEAVMETGKEAEPLALIISALASGGALPPSSTLIAEP
ncbi:MAG: hypothetical protein LBD13_07030 [Spirochaetaceae bacterium]|nr:hypothetical protein [Spirochaetaceae bacterium]